MAHRTLCGTVLTLVAVLIAALTAPAGAQIGDEPARCRGRVVTVDVGAGGSPTSGDDVILGTDGDDVIDALAGDDVVCGGRGDDRLDGNIGNDILIGGPGKDRLLGGAGADQLIGGRGNDRLAGSGGRDRLAGGRGIDTLIGGADNDRCNDVKRVRRVKSCETGSVFPGAGAEPVVMARANWASGYIQAEIMHQVAEELGYEVEDPARNELSPDLAYNLMGEGRIDFWTNSWYPGHQIWWEDERPDGRRIGNFLTKFDAYVQSPEGILIDAASAERYNIGSFEDVANSPELLTALDRDGNGIAEIWGCPTDWSCDEQIDRVLDKNGWNGVVFEQLTNGYDAMFAEALDLVRAGEPALYFTWGPSAYHSILKPGEEVLWLGFEDPPFLLEAVELPESAGRCVSDPCFTGFGGSEITPTANKGFLTKNPSFARLLEAARIPTVDASDFQVAQANGDGSQSDVVELAETWIRENRRLVNQWLNAGRTSR